MTTYNGFIKLKNGVEEAFSTMDVYLKKRYDLIPNIVETVKGYAAHETEAIEALGIDLLMVVAHRDMEGLHGSKRNKILHFRKRMKANVKLLHCKSSPSYTNSNSSCIINKLGSVAPTGKIIPSFFRFFN